MVDNTVSKNKCTIKIQNFEGPLDLLYNLIGKKKVDIYDVRIEEVADQYLNYLSKMEKLDLEIASEFLVIAATLLNIKSRLLLPSKTKEQEADDVLDPKEELLLKILHYKKHKDFSAELSTRQAYWQKCIYKRQESIEFEFEKKMLNLEPKMLKNLYVEMLKRNKAKKNPKGQEDIVKIVQYEKVTIKSKLREVLRFLINKPKTYFSEIFLSKNKTKLEIITGFLAILELAKSRKISIYQDENFSDISINKLEAVQNLEADNLEDENFREEKNIG